MRMSQRVLVTLLALSAATAAAQVCDLVELDTVSTAGTAGPVAIFGNTAYVAAGSVGIVRIDITDPTQLDVLGTTATQGQARDITIDFLSGVTVVADGAAGVSVYTIEGDGTLVHRGSVHLGETAISIAGFSGLYTVGTEEGSLNTISVDASGVGLVLGLAGVSRNGSTYDLSRPAIRTICSSCRMLRTV